MTSEERASREESASGGDSEEMNPEVVYERSGEDIAQEQPDVLLDVPEVQVEELNLEVADLKAHVSLRTRLSDLLDINVGLEVSLSEVKLETKGVEAEAQLKARLQNVQDMVERTLSSVDANPELIKDLTNLAKHGENDQTPQQSQQHESREQNQQNQQSQQPALQEDRAENSGPRITAAAQKKAGELGVDTASLQGTGSGGRIVLGDVQRASRTS